MDSLGVFQTFMKVFKVLIIIAIVVFGIALVGVGILFGCILSPDLLTELNGILVEANMKELGEGAQPLILTAGIALVGALVVEILTLKYVNKEINDGTPFTFDGAKKLQILAICSIIVPIVAFIISEIIIMAYGVSITNESSVINDSILGSGLILLAGSFAFKYGAEIQNKKGC